MPKGNKILTAKFQQKALETRMKMSLIEKILPGDTVICHLSFGKNGSFMMSIPEADSPLMGQTAYSSYRKAQAVHTGTTNVCAF